MKYCATLVLLLFFTASPAMAEPALSAKETIAAFYKKYLTFMHVGMPEQSAPTLSFSESFKQLQAREAEVCTAHAGTDICGWGADGDVYLNTQEIDPNLSYENSGITITEPKPGKVVVRLNVYPSYKSSDGYYNKTIIYWMIKENNQWVVNDMMDKEKDEKNISACTEMKHTLDYYKSLQ